MKLSICVCSLYSRRAKLDELLTALITQTTSTHDVEIVISMDNAATPVGAKRNQLVRAARGAYICHVDDDDLVHSTYIEKIIKAIDDNPGIDAIAIRGRRITEWSGETVEFDYRLEGDEGVWIDNVMWRSPGHLCPIRADLVRSIPFPEITGGEDLKWNAALKPYLATCVRAADYPLYLYRWNPNKVRGT
jgi:glycosyltransferase involved in cell wall biosynthesis